jgi:NADH:ubiquinone oxidoreductase subunit 3 (subunit A)
MFEKILISPPISLLLLFAGIGILSAVLSRLAFQKRKDGRASRKAYSCGETFDGHWVQPDYSQFFPFAFFFMILHVVALVIATVPRGGAEIFSMAVVYVLSAAVSLIILQRK